MKRLTLVLALLALCGCSVQTLGAPKGNLTISATFDDVQSLVVGHGVQLSDIKIGTVTGIRLISHNVGYRARVTMSLRDEHIPSGTGATIAKTSLLGENYVRLNLPPGTDPRTGPYLHSGAAISQTSVQPDLEQISEKAGPILTALGGGDLRTVLGSTSAAVAGKGRQLNDLIAKATRISDSYAAASTDLGRALDGLASLGHSLAKNNGQIDRLPGNVLLATQRLQEDRAQLKRTVEELTALTRTLNGRIQERHGARLKALLTRADTLLTAAVRGKQELKTLTAGLLKFAQSPSVTYQGQALLYGWVAGLLPPRTGGTGGSKGPGLRQLLEPAP